MPTTSLRAAAVAVATGVVLATGTIAAAVPAAHPRARVAARVATLPQTARARLAATWLAKQITSAGDIVQSGTPDLSDTAAAVLALAAAGNEHRAALRALRYLEAHVSAYVVVSGSDDAGRVATLILDAHVMGVSPTKFGGTNLVRALLATMRKSGSDVGLFGAQDPTYDGTYREGLALAALAAAGVTRHSEVGPALTWLKHQQCANGSWEAYRSPASAPCPPTDPTTYSGPDTNSTALAIEGLIAQHVTIARDPVKGFIRPLEAPDGGWGYYGGTSDPDSTALVIQALLALRDTVSSAAFRKGSHDPVSALLGYQLASGAFFFPGAGSTPSLLATEQAIPALAKQALPF